METEYLYYFKTISETENISAAAKKLNISQPSLSRMLKNLETDFGCLLFDRNGKNLKLNPAGQLLLDYSNLILPLVTRAYSDLRSFSDSTQTINLKMVGSNRLLPSMLADFSSQNPKIQINLSRFETEENIDYDNDIYIHVSDKLASEYPSQKLIDEECLIGVSKNHPFAKLEEIPLEKLASEKFVALNANNLLGSTTLQFFSNAQIHPNIAIECDNQTAIESFVALNVGIGIFPSLTWVPTDDNVIYKKIKDYNILRSLYITTLTPSKSVAINTFIQFAVDYFRASVDPSTPQVISD